MKAAQGRLGRIFVLRLEDGDPVPACIERFAADQEIEAALCVFVGGIGRGSLVVGPEDAERTPIVPLLQEVLGVHEAAGVGTLFPGEDGTPRVHLHAALGRGGATRTGCVRRGVEVWKVGEVVLLELLGTGLGRSLDPDSGFEVLTAIGSS